MVILPIALAAMVANAMLLVGVANQVDAWGADPAQRSSRPEDVPGL